MVGYTHKQSWCFLSALKRYSSCVCNVQTRELWYNFSGVFTPWYFCSGQNQPMSLWTCSFLLLFVFLFGLFSHGRFRPLLFGGHGAAVWRSPKCNCSVYTQANELHQGGKQTQDYQSDMLNLQLLTRGNWLSREEEGDMCCWCATFILKLEMPFFFCCFLHVFKVLCRFVFSEFLHFVKPRSYFTNTNAQHLHVIDVYFAY